MKRDLVPFLLLVVVVRLLLFAQLGQDPRFDTPYSDMAIYHNWGSYWMDGDAYVEEPVGEPFWRSPGYPAFVSLVYRVVGDNLITGPRTIAAIQLLLGGAASLAVIAFVLRRWGTRAAWATALLTQLHAPLVYMEALQLPVGLAIPLLTFTALLTFRLLDSDGEDEASQLAPKSRFRIAAGCGLMAGINAVIRPNLGLVIPLICWLLWRRKPLRMNSYVLAIAAALPLIGTTTWNLARSGEFVVTGANGPMNLYFSYGEHAGPTFDVRDHRWGNPMKQSKLARRISADERGEAFPYDDLTTKEVSRYWGDKATTWIKEHPDQALARATEKALGTITWRDLAVIAPIGASKDVILILNLLIIPFPLLFFLALFGAWRFRGSAWHAVLLGYVPILISAVLYFTYTRFRVPCVPLLGLAAGPGLIELGRILGSLRKGGGGLAASMPGVALPGLKLGAFALITAGLVAASWTPWFSEEALHNKNWNTPLASGWTQKGISYINRYKKGKEAGRPDPRILLDQAIPAFETALSIQSQTPLPEEWIARLKRDHLGEGDLAFDMLVDLTQRFPAHIYPGAHAELGLTIMAGFGPDGMRARRANDLFETAESYNGLGSQYLEAWADALHQLGRSTEACGKLKLLLQVGFLTEEERQRIRDRRADWGCD